MSEKIKIPYDENSEAALLGAILLRPEIAADMVDRLRVEHFYVPAHKHIFAAIGSLVQRGGTSVDVVTVNNELQKAGVDGSVGGVAKLIDLQTNCPAVSNASAYALSILDNAQRRRLMEASAEIQEAALSSESGHNAIIEAERVIGEAADVTGKEVSATHIVDLFNDHRERLDTLRNTKGELIGVPTGYHELDDMLLGLQGGQMVVVGARPAMGKTALTLSMAANVAQQTQKPVLFFSLEMSRMEVVDRLVAGYARIPLRNVRSADMSPDEWKRYDAVHSAIESVPLFVVDEPGVDLARIRMEVRKLRQMEGELGLVVIDYLQLMTPGGVGGGRKSREQEVSEMSRGIKLTAKEFNVPILSLSQLSRNLEQRADKRPILADLRESGCLTEDTLILRADTNEEVSLGELFRNQIENIPVWSISEDYKLTPANMTKVFYSGEKDIYELRLRSGRKVKASGNHPFMTVEGWKPLDDLIVTDHVAVPLADPNFPTWPDEIEDVIPEQIWKYISRVAIPGHSMTGKTFREHLSRQHNTSTMIMGHDITRDRMETIVKILKTDVHLYNLLTGDVLWDEIVAIEHIGVEKVYDATVEETHNFIANGIVVHNSIEQDADIVLFLYRDEVYHPDTPDIGTAEIIVAKHRQGSSGTCRVGFISSYALFANMNAPSVLTAEVTKDYLPSLAGEPERKTVDSDQFYESSASAGYNEF